MTVQLHTIDVETLKKKWDDEKPNNTDTTRGYALVNVLKPEAFQEEHIPGSINIPMGMEHRFEDLFDKEKEIIVYCASLECTASPNVAEELTRRGFTQVNDFETGMSEWKKAGYPVASAKK